MVIRVIRGDNYFYSRHFFLKKSVEIKKLYLIKRDKAFKEFSTFKILFFLDKSNLIRTNISIVQTRENLVNLIALSFYECLIKRSSRWNNGMF